MLQAYLRGHLAAYVTTPLEYVREKMILDAIDRENRALNMEAFAKVLSPLGALIQKSSRQEFMNNQQDRVLEAGKLRSHQLEDKTEDLNTILDVDLETLYNHLKEDGTLFEAIFDEETAARYDELRAEQHM